MDFPYIAVIWNPLDPAQANAANRLAQRASPGRWQPLLRRAGLRVYVQEPPVPYLRAHILQDDFGVILGILFHRNHNIRLTASDIRQDPHMTNDGANILGHLTRNLWGGYVALLSDRRTGDWWVSRDCSAMIPCYYTVAQGITVISSDVRNFFCFTTEGSPDSPVIPFEINWQYLAGFLAHTQLQIHDTGLKNISELLAGETLTSRNGRHSVSTTWNPATYADANSSESLDSHCEALHSTVRSCIDAWSGISQRVVHSLSGGFDSSLVLSLLNRARNRPDLVCINRYSHGPAEDERSYAQVAARAANVPLIEWPWIFGNQTLDATCTTVLYGAKPSVHALFSPYESPFYAALRAAQDFDAIWTGEGGDHLFLAWATELTINDFLRHRGFRKDLLRVLRDTARLTGWSIPHLAFGAIQRSKHAIRDTHASRSPAMSLLSSRCRQHFDIELYTQSPWVSETQTVAPGKQQQILQLAEVLHRHRPIPDTQDGVELYPLLSQPIIEQCLRIPSYELLTGGHTRGLARRAFRNDLPARILNREVKGQTTHHALAFINRSLPFASRLLVNGILADHGLLDQIALGPLITGRMPITEVTLFPTCACIAAETWARTWLGTTRPEK